MHTEYVSIRQGLLTFLDTEPSYGYELKTKLEAGAAGTWPLNIGQIYTTLGRLERDGLVRSEGADGAGRQMWSITDAGREELTSWFSTPMRAGERPRDDLAIKLALAETLGRIDTQSVIQAQRADTLRLMQGYTRMKSKSADPSLAAEMVLDALIFRAEAEVRWLDHCESRLLRRQSSQETAPGGK